MLDAGTGAFRAADYLATEELDVFLTHAHLDHVVGLTYLIDVRRVHPLRRITVHGLADNLRAVENHLFAEALFPAEPPCGFRPLEKSFPLAEGGAITHFPLEHRGGAIGYRLDWPGRSMAYVTDTTADANAPYVAWIRDVDLLVHECYFDDDQVQRARETGHSCISAVARTAQAAGAKQLVLVHLNPLAPADQPVDLDAARAIFPRTTIGEDRMELEF